MPRVASARSFRDLAVLVLPLLFLGAAACARSSAAPAPSSSAAVESSGGEEGGGALVSIDPRRLKEGDPAPDFEALGDDGQRYSLSGLKGRSVVLFFYPKDDTPGCTAEAQGFRDEAEAFAARGAVVLGVSLDDAESHRAFREKHDLNFPLLVGGKELAQRYGVPVRFGYASRQTFVIDGDGRLLKVFRSVSPSGHAQEVLKVLDGA